MDMMVSDESPSQISDKIKDLLFAKSAILEEMKSTVSRNVKLSLASGKFVQDEALKEEIKDEVSQNAVIDDRGVKSAYNKAMELLNRKLDAEIDKTAPPPPPTGPTSRARLGRCLTVAWPRALW